MRATEGQAGRFRWERLHYVAGQAVPRYEHEAFNVCLLLSGSVVERREGGTHRHVGPSLTLNLPPVAHEFVVGPGGAHCFSVDVPPAWVAGVAEAGRARPEPVVALGRPDAVFAALRLHEEALRPDDLSPLVVEENVIATVTASGDGSPAARAGGTPGWLERVRQRLEDEPGEAHTLEGLAREAGVHRVHLARSFRRWFGVAVGDYVRRIRLRRALEQIANTDEQLGRIALRAGYYDQAHFNRRFRMIAGMTPGRFRRLVRPLHS